MDRTRHTKYFVPLTKDAPYVDLYWQGAPRAHDPSPPLDTGLSQPIYDLHGNIQFSLPLDQYPPVNDQHRQIVQMKRQANQRK